MHKPAALKVKTPRPPPLPMASNPWATLTLQACRSCSLIIPWANCTPWSLQVMYMASLTNRGPFDCTIGQQGMYGPCNISHGQVFMAYRIWIIAGAGVLPWILCKMMCNYCSWSRNNDTRCCDPLLCHTSADPGLDRAPCYHIISLFCQNPWTEHFDITSYCGNKRNTQMHTKALKSPCTII